jgi:very-short-patch-repair endonuclease
MSFPEVLLWQALRKDAHGPRFRRQHPIGPYIVDFYCPLARLAVEIDGADHHGAEAAEFDERRDAWLRRQGVEVLRIAARLVFEDMDAAILTIVGSAQARLSERSS